MLKVVRTPDDRFEEMVDFPFPPNYVITDGIRVHYIDTGDPAGSPVLLMHGEPTWCYLYRKVIRVLVRNGCRAVAPDLVGFGRSDKPTEKQDYSYLRQVKWMTQWLDAVDLQDITLVCQDWGSLIGLRVVAERPEKFARIVLANGGLPTGEERRPAIVRLWQIFAKYSPWFPIGRIVAAGCSADLAPEVVAAYEAPFPDSSYKAGARIMPSLIPVGRNDPASADNRRAWDVLEAWDKPFLTAFSDSDPITRGMERRFQRRVPGASGQPHIVIQDAGHFVQEDKAEELAQVVVELIARAS